MIRSEFSNARKSAFLEVKDTRHLNCIYDDISCKCYLFSTSTKSYFYYRLIVV